MTALYCCEVCGAERPMWALERVGDVASTWACAEHLSAACEALQRDHEVTRVQVRLLHKSHEWAEITETLRRVADEASP